MNPTPHRPDEEVIPSAPVPARTERRVDTTSQPQPQEPGSGPEDLSAPEGRLPHERDEATSMTGGARSPVVEQAYDDLQRGLKDTDRGTPAHEAYQKQKEPSAPE